ncbi:uncharacterized protein LOC134776625 [Penaeus indicus]|uniref:uncharacterized protein LOC134776625 n=1 Tax=Penaeus indicus TaxID=29960 RepID=UPI00300D7319
MKACMLLAVVAVTVAIAAAQGPGGRRPPPGGAGGRRPPHGGPGGRRPPRGPPPCIEYLCDEDTECPKCIGDIIHSSEDSTLKDQLHECYTAADDCIDESAVDQATLLSCIQGVNADMGACFPAK